MTLRPNNTENIRNKINKLEEERQGWLKRLQTARGVDKRLAQTALTQLEARLRWYRGRAEGRKPDSAHSKAGRRATKALNTARLAEARS